MLVGYHVVIDITSLTLSSCYPHHVVATIGGAEVHSVVAFGLLSLWRIVRIHAHVRGIIDDIIRHDAMMVRGNHDIMIYHDNIMIYRYLSLMEAGLK